MGRPHIFLALIGAGVCAVFAGPANAAACPTVEAEAAEVTALRDVDAARGRDRGIEALERARAAAEPCPAGEALLLAAIGSNLHILGRNHDAVAHFREALQLLPQDAPAAHRATVHRGAGVALADIENFEAALEHYMVALAASREAGEQLEAAKTAGNIGNLYSTIGELERSREYHEQALADFQAIGFEPGIAGSLVNLGAVAAKFAAEAQARGDSQEAQRENRLLRSYNERALELFTTLGNERGIAYATSNIALATERLGDPAQSLVHHERALELRRRIGDVHGQVNSHVEMAYTLMRLHRYADAQAHLDEATSVLDEDQHHGLLLAVAARRVELAEAQGDYPAALQWQREVTRLRGAIADEDHAARIAELEGRFDHEQQAREIELLRSNAEVRELQLGRQRLYFHVSVVIAVLLLLLFGVILSRQRLGRAAARELERAARTDPVTGLANRRHMISQLEQELTRSRRSGHPFSVLMADIDRFKAINDAYGHGAGDAVLAEVAQRLSRRVRAQDTVARWGGEEFLILLPDTDLGGAHTLGEALREAVSASPMQAGEQPLVVRITIGAAEFHEGMTLDALVNAADLAMYRGKREGGDRITAVGGQPPPDPAPVFSTGEVFFARI
jgi:diguanylate cyclase (GGDEF)-like protein